MPLLTAALITTIVDYAQSHLTDYFFGKAADRALSAFERKQIDELRVAIGDSLVEFESRFPIAAVDRRFPFYHSQRVINELLSFRVMRKEQYDVRQLLNALETEPNVIPPTQEQLQAFWDIFIDKVEGSEALKQLEINESYKDEVFHISRKLTEIQSQIENIFEGFNADLELQVKNRLDSYVRRLQEFRPATALGLLNDLLESFDTLTRKPPLPLQAIIHYQRGTCLRILGERDEASKAYVKAFQIDGASLLNHEQAALSYFRMGDIDKAIATADSLIDRDNYNPFGWAVKLALQPGEDLPEFIRTVPGIVKRDLHFQMQIHGLLSAAKSQEALDVVFMAGLIPDFTAYTPKQITVNNIGEHGFWINLMFNDYFKDFFFNFHELHDEEKNGLAFAINDLLQRYLDSIAGSELKDDQANLRVMLAYTYYLRNKEDRYALEMKTWFDQSKKKSTHLTMLCANVLQQAGHIDLAIEIGENCQNRGMEILMLLAHCYLRSGKGELFARMIRDLCREIKVIQSAMAPIFANYIIELKRFGVANEFSSADFLTEKQFESQADRHLVGLIAKVLLEEISDGVIEEMMAFAQTTEDPDILGIIATALHLKGFDGHAVSVFRRFVNSDKEGRDLYHYIRALYNTKKDNEELLNLLEKWRLNASFEPLITRIELQELSTLANWQKFIEVGTYYLDQYPEDETVLVRYVFAIYQVSSPEALQILSALVPRLHTQEYGTPEHASTVGRILIKTKHIQEGLDILFRYAINPVNKSVRTSYFLAFTDYREENASLWPVREFETVEAGHFVKYSIDKKIKFVELNERNLELPFNQQFIGCKKGGAFVAERPMTGDEDVVTVERIMDKYLYLHDEILEEVADNPYSGIPLQSFQIDPQDPMSIQTVLQKMVGAQGSRERDVSTERIEEYYNYTRSFSEVIVSALRGKFLPGYFELSRRQKGINLIPLIAIPDIAADQYMIDLSSLPLIYQLHLKHGTKFEGKLIISKYLVDHIREELVEARENDREQITVSVTKEGVTPQILGEEAQKGNIKYLEGLLAWVNNNCEIKLTARTLDFTREMQVNHESKDFVDYFLNTSLLLEDNAQLLLITDDLMYYKLGTPRTRLRSTEWYVKRILGPDAIELDEFIVNRYRLFTLNARQLNDQYTYKAAGKANEYNFCLENISVAHNPANVGTGVEHIRWIMLNQFHTDAELALIIANIFTHMVQGISMPAVKHLLRITVNDRFKLLGAKQDLVLNTLAAVLEQHGLE